jgi:hypothetical protein
MQILEERLGAWAAGADDSGDWKDVLRRADDRPSTRNYSRRRLALAFAVVVVAVGSSLAGVFLVHGTGPAPTGPGGPGAPSLGSPPDGSNPWGEHGRQITIDELRAEAPSVPLPDSPPANDSNVGTVWVWDHTSDATVPEGHVAAAVFYPASGIQLLWTATGFDYTGFPSQMIDGVRAGLIPREQTGIGPTGMRVTRWPVSTLRLPVGAGAVLQLGGDVPESLLIDVAHTLRPSPGDASPAGDLPPENPQPGPYLTLWDTLLTDGVAAGSVQEAADSLAFRPVAPPSLGDPSAIRVTNPAQTSASDRVLSLRYEGAAGSPFWVLERPSLATNTSLLSAIASACDRETGCKSTASMIDLGHGVLALSMENDVTNRIVWVENGVYYDVAGAASTFFAADALSAAKAVAAAAAG